MPTRFFAVAPTLEEPAEAGVAVRDERTHPKLIGPGESLAVLRVGGLQVKRVGLRGDLTEEAEDPPLVAALLLPLREIESAPGDRARVVSAAGQQMRHGLSRESRQSTGSQNEVP